jgi:hypothetical protein
MSEEEAFCAHCGVAAPTPAKQPSAWRRVVTGIIGFPLVVSGAFLVLLGLLFFAECRAEDASLGEAIGILIAVLGAGMALVGTPFALAAIVPFGTARRVLVGVGAAALGDILFARALPDEARALAVLVAAGLFYVAYRIAR